jgi:hypothetical protein
MVIEERNNWHREMEKVERLYSDNVQQKSKART